MRLTSETVLWPQGDAGMDPGIAKQAMELAHRTTRSFQRKESAVSMRDRDFKRMIAKLRKDTATEVRETNKLKQLVHLHECIGLERSQLETDVITQTGQEPLLPRPSGTDAGTTDISLQRSGFPRVGRVCRDGGFLMRREDCFLTLRPRRRPSTQGPFASRQRAPGPPQQDREPQRPGQIRPSMPHADPHPHLPMNESNLQVKPWTPHPLVFHP